MNCAHGLPRRQGLRGYQIDSVVVGKANPGSANPNRVHARQRHQQYRAHGNLSAEMRRGRHLKENEAMTGIQYVTDEKGRKVGVLIDLKKHRAVWEDFWDGLVSESRLKEKGLLYEQYRANRLKRVRQRG